MQGALRKKLPIALVHFKENHENTIYVYFEMII